MRSVLALFIPLVAMTSQNSAAGTVIPPFLDALHYPVSLIGSLVSVSPFFSLAARIPAGLIYRGERARRLIAVLLSVTIVCNLAYGYAVHPLLFGIVHGANGFASGAATTVYLALFVESLPSGADRSHAIGYYAGCMAVGFSSGSFIGGFIADRWGYPATFQFAALLAGFALAAFLVLTSRIEARVGAGAGRPEYRRGPALKSLKIILEPKMATIAVVALFLNMLHQMGTAFFPLYGLAVGLGMTQVGSVRGLYALCNAVTRPLTGFVVKRLGARRLAYAGLPLECAVVMLVPFFQEFAPLAVIFVIAGLLRAVVLVANTVSLVQDLEPASSHRGVVSGVFNAAGDLGNILGPTVGGLIASFTGVARLFFFGPLLITLLFFASVLGCGYFERRSARAAGRVDERE